ncbi:putative dehydrogenase [Kineococcus xinjiangensis]|uniref:Putative dehydrogenase n=1 Tax=Kineococcus xinjiangensis TaxID=512762 RepID=A0A2S6ICX8_9ACTN|nr:Gfo/Idh/MocA family oxidoreductase [Kineococcus xinjiangensis]PPK92078.1 putative dehydrogenase [Kineococcus xinjiangensis]
MTTVPDPAEPLRVVVVGAGAIAEGGHLPALRDAGDTEVVAIVDVDADRARGLAERWGVPASGTDLAAVLREQRPHLVCVCTPPGAHRDAVTAALDAGAWVWCEKPPALSLAEYDEMAAHEREGGPYVSYVFQQRSGSASHALRRQIALGELGRPLVAVCHTLWFRDEEYYAVPWRGRWDTEGGGPSMGHGIHQMDLMLWLLGDWSEVSAATGTLDRDVETEDVSMAVVRFESGAMASVVNSVLSPRQESYLRFDFSDATVEVSHLYGHGNDDWTWTPAPHVPAGRTADWRPAGDEPSSHTAALRDVLDSLRKGVRPPGSGHDGRRSLELVAGLYQSAAQGRPVRRAELVAGNPFYAAMHGGRA